MKILFFLLPFFLPCSLIAENNITAQNEKGQAERTISTASEEVVSSELRNMLDEMGFNDISFGTNKFNVEDIFEALKKTGIRTRRIKGNPINSSRQTGKTRRNNQKK